MTGIATPAPETTGRAQSGRAALTLVEPVSEQNGYRHRVEELLGVVARASLEVLAGRRRLRQLLRLVSPAVYDRLRTRLPAPRRRDPTAATVERVIAAWPTPRACEATVLLDRGGRITALALRAERYEQRWRIVEIAAPEEGLEPTSTRSTHRGPSPPGA